MAKQVVLGEPLKLGGVNANGADIRFEASPEEMSQVVEIIGIVGLDKLEGEVRINHGIKPDSC